MIFQDIYISTVWNINDFKWISLHNISFDSIEFSSKISQNTVTYVTDMEKVWCAFSPKDRATYNARAYFVGYVISFIVMSNLFFFLLFNRWFNILQLYIYIFTYRITIVMNIFSKLYSFKEIIHLLGCNVAI